MVHFSYISWKKHRKNLNVTECLISSLISFWSHLIHDLMLKAFKSRALDCLNTFYYISNITNLLDYTCWNIRCIGAKTKHSINIWKIWSRKYFLSISSTNLGRNHSRLTSFVLWLAWNMQTTIPIAFWPPLVFSLCPSLLDFSWNAFHIFFDVAS